MTKKKKPQITQITQIASYLPKAKIYKKTNIRTRIEVTFHFGKKQSA